VENAPRSVYFKVDFINFFRRSVLFGAIFSYRFDHIFIGEKIYIFDEYCEKGDFVSVISPWKQSPQSKFVGPKRTSRIGQEDGWENKRKKTYLRGQFCCAKSSFYGIFFNFFARFCHFLAIFWPFFGRYQVCLMDLRLPTTIGVKWCKCFKWIFCPFHGNF